MSEVAAQANPVFDPVRVVVVDDQELFRRGLRLLLGQEDEIEVVGEAGDGCTAVDVVATAVPDVVLMDVRMPQSDGIQACSLLKEIAPTVKIIMLTVGEDEAGLHEAVKAGASGYLIKDSSVDDVAHAVHVVAAGQPLLSPTMASTLLDESNELMRRESHAQLPTPRLTDRELEVLKLVAEGMTNKDIARRLVMSENTVKNHVRNFLEKLQLYSRMEAALCAFREHSLEIR